MAHSVDISFHQYTYSTLTAVYTVGSRVIVLLLSFTGYFVQLAHSCASAHLFSDTGHLLSTASPSSRACTVDAWEARGHTNSELYALHSTDVTREVRPVRRILVILYSWFLLDETFAVVLTNGNSVADRCSTVLLYDRDVRWSVSIRWPARAVRDTDRPASGTTWSSPSPSFIHSFAINTENTITSKT